MTYQFSYKDVIMIIDLRLKSVLYLINFLSYAQAFVIKAGLVS